MACAASLAEPSLSAFQTLAAPQPCTGAAYAPAPAAAGGSAGSAGGGGGSGSAGSVILGAVAGAVGTLLVAMVVSRWRSRRALRSEPEELPRVA